AAFYAWKKRNPEREIAWQAALAARASTFAEDGIDILDGLADADPTNEEIRLAEARVAHRKWLASVSDRERYGQQTKVDVNLSVNGLHLTATRNVEALFNGDDDEVEDADFEVVPEERR